MSKLINKFKTKCFKSNKDILSKKLSIQSFGNVSQKISSDLFVIKPSGVNLNQIKSKDLVIVKISSGKIIKSKLKESSDTETHRVLYKSFPQIFPEIVIRTIPQRFFLIHSVVGYPLIISIFYKFLERFFIHKKFNKNFPFQLIVIVIIIHLVQQHDVIEKRLNNIKDINEDKIEENFFWKQVNDLKINGYILTSNNLCNKTIIYGNLPILFCFHPLDIIPLFPKLASPIKKITDKVLGVSFDELKYRNLSGISEIEIKKIYENKTTKEWIILKEDLNLTTIIVPKDWNLNLDLIIEDKYRVYKIE